MKTKLLALILALVLMGTSAVVLTSCGENDEVDSSINQTTETTKIYEEFEWPDGTLASLLPVPKSNIGEVSLDTSDMLSVEVAQTEAKDY